MDNRRVNKFGAIFDDEVIKDILSKACKCPKNILFTSNSESESSYSASFAEDNTIQSLKDHLSINTKSLNNINDKDEDKSVGELIGDLYDKRFLNNNKRKTVIDNKILRVYFSILLVQSMMSKYKYSELQKPRGKIPYDNRIKSENVNIFGEVPALTYLLEKDRWKKVSQRRYKQYINKLVNQCYMYNLCREFIDTPERFKYNMGDLFVLKPRYETIEGV